MPKNIAKSARKNTDNLPKDADRFHATSAAFRASMVETEGRAKDKSARARARKVPSATVTSAAAAAVLQAPEPLVPKRNGKSTKFSSLLPLTPTPSAIMSSGNERAGPSGYQKKARTISSTEFLQVTSGGAEVVEMGSSQPEPADSDSSGAAAGGAGVGSSSAVAPSDQDTVGTSSSLVTGDMAATSSQEEILDCELDVEDEGEISEDLEDDGDADLNADNLEGTTDEDENNVQEEDVEVHSEEEIEVDQPDVGVEDNSSEPSSSTGARQPARPLGGAVSGYEQDPGDTDSVVPTTPKLPLPRRNDGFAEAVSSPQVFQNYIFDMRRLWARLSSCCQLFSIVPCINIVLCNLYYPGSK